MCFGIIIYSFPFEFQRTLLVLDSEDQHHPPKSLSYTAFPFLPPKCKSIDKGGSKIRGRKIIC